MTRHNCFLIRNELPKTLTLNIEPEGAFFSLAKGEEVSVTEAFSSAPVTLRLTNSEKGEPILSIWPGDGEVCVQKNGIDVFDLVQKGTSG